MSAAHSPPTTATPTVAAILAIFGLGLPAFVLIKAFTPGYFAREDTRTPMIFAAISVAVNVVDGADAVSRGSARPASPSPRPWPAGSMRCCCLRVLIRRGHWGRDVPLLTRIPRLVVAAAVMGGCSISRDHWLRRRSARLAAYAQAMHAAPLWPAGARSISPCACHRRRRFRHDPAQRQRVGAGERPDRRSLDLGDSSPRASAS